MESYARDNGDIDWLSMVESHDEDYAYKDFLKSVDTVIMGRRTYDQVLTFWDFPYKDSNSIGQGNSAFSQ